MLVQVPVLSLLDSESLLLPCGKDLPQTPHVPCVVHGSRVHGVFLLPPNHLACLIFHCFPHKPLLQLRFAVFHQTCPLSKYT